MSVKPLKPKSRKAAASSGFLTVYEGAVRSAKTVTSLVQWYRYISQSPENVFLMTGNTLGSISRNCINGDFGFIALTDGLAKPRTDTDGSKFLQLGRKKIYYCGSDNEASYKKIRGLTIGGWYADEIDLHAKSFIETALARSFASHDRQNIWTLNPNQPNHWIYKEYIDRYKEEKTPGYRWFHFVLDDNPALTEQRKAEIAAQFTGVFYKRYVLGQRVRAEGIIYRSWIHNRIGETGNVLYEYPKNIYRTTFGLDFGGNTSATKFTCTGWFLKDKQLCIVALAEQKIVHKDNDLGVGYIIGEWKAFYALCSMQWPVDRVFADSAEQLIIKSMRELPGIAHVENAAKRPIIDRIRAADLLYAQGRKFVMHTCGELINAIESAVWDDKATGESRLDDGSLDIDSLDSDEYSWERDITQLIEGGQ